MAEGAGGFLLDPAMHRLGKEIEAALKARVARELKTTFATHYARSVSLAQGTASGRDRRIHETRNRLEVPHHADSYSLKRQTAAGQLY